MGKQQKPKTGKSRNDDRKNGKAVKQTPGKIGGVGSRRTPLTEVQKVLIGKGLYQKWNRVIDGKTKGIPGKRVSEGNDF